MSRVDENNHVFYECPECNGTGENWLGMTCFWCNGYGEILDGDSVTDAD